MSYWNKLNMEGIPGPTIRQLFTSAAAKSIKLPDNELGCGRRCLCQGTASPTSLRHNLAPTPSTKAFFQRQYKPFNQWNIQSAPRILILAPANEQLFFEHFNYGPRNGIRVYRFLKRSLDMRRTLSALLNLWSVVLFFVYLN